MATRKLTAHVDRFAGLSDRSIPVQNTRIECADLLNLDFSERAMKVRQGFSRLNSTPFKDCCASLDGYNDFGRIKGMSFASGDRFGFACEIQIRAYTTSTNATVLSRGYDTGANRFVHCYYDFSSTGSWVVKVYDATAGVLKTWTVTDGDAARTQIMANRHLEFYNSSGTTWTFRVRDGAGTEIGSDALSTIGSFITTSLDFWVGVDTTAGTDAPSAADTSYGPFNISDLRFLKNSAGSMGTTVFNAATAQITGRQLRSYVGEYAASTNNGLYAYFPMTEGTGNQSVDACTSSTTVIQWGAAGPDWVTDNTLKFGQSALKFGGEDGEVIWNLGGGATGTTSTIIFKNSGTGTTGYRKWLVSFVFVPLLATGETTVRDQTLLWWGTDTTNPAPLGVRVVSNQIRTYFQDNASTKTQDVVLDLAANVNKRIRVSVVYTDAATPSIRTILAVEGSTGNYPTVTTNLNATDYATPSDFVCVGRLCTSFTYPYTFNDLSAFGIIDDIVIFKDYYTGNGTGPYILPGYQFREINISEVVSGNTPATPSNLIQIVAGLRLNDGTGNNLATIGNATSQTAYLFPEGADGIWWDNGFVTLADPPEIDLIQDFSRVGPKGELISETMVLCGGGLWGFNQSTAAIRPLGFIPKTGKASYTQYGSVAYIGRGNGHRPFRCDGSSTYPMGIRAPVVACTAAAAAGAGFAAGTWYVYYTFRNPQTGVESNPSPYTAVTTSGGNLSISVTLLQRSSEKQVGQRRIYVVGTAGSITGTAYLAATVEENRSTTVAVTISAAGTTNTLTYTANRESPTGSLVRVYKDRMWVAGIPLFPTRLYYSAVGNMEEFNWSTGYVDVDLDSGDPVVGLTTMYDRLVAYIRDGRVFITATGDTTTPFLLNFASRNLGAVAHNAIIAADHPPVVNDKQGLHVFMADSQIALWDGGGTENLSSPPGFDKPSIEYTYRAKLNRSYSYKWTAAPYSLRRQLWFAVSSSSSTKCDIVLVFDVGQGVWTRHRLDAEFLQEIDDTTGTPCMMFGSHGYLCKVGGQNFDGLSAVFSSLASSGSAYYAVTQTAMTADAYNGLIAHVYDASASRYYLARIVYNTTTELYLDTSGTSLPTLATADIVAIGGIGTYADFVMDFGSVLSLKRARWLSFGAYLPQDGYILGCVAPYSLSRTLSFASATDYAATYTTTVGPKAEALVGGLARAFIVRIGGNQYVTDIGSPTFFANWFITEFAMEAEEVEAR